MLGTVALSDVPEKMALAPAGPDSWIPEFPTVIEYWPFGLLITGSPAELYVTGGPASCPLEPIAVAAAKATNPAIPPTRTTSTRFERIRDSFRRGFASRAESKTGDGSWLRLSRLI
jgi:hypothetical protein